MIDLHIKEKCFVCPCPELQIEKLVYKTCAGKTDVHIHIFCQNEEKCKEMQEDMKWINSNHARSAVEPGYGLAR